MISTLSLLAAPCIYKRVVLRQRMWRVVEEDMRRIQIRETIASHFEKRSSSLTRALNAVAVFIDEVAVSSI